MKSYHKVFSHRETKPTWNTVQKTCKTPQQTFCLFLLSIRALTSFPQKTSFTLISLYHQTKPTSNILMWFVKSNFIGKVLLFLWPHKNPVSFRTTEESFQAKLFTYLSLLSFSFHYIENSTFFLNGCKRERVLSAELRIQFFSPESKLGL